MVNKNLCTGCRACELVCPVKAITMVKNSEGFLYPEINDKKCIKCGLCDKVCDRRLEKNKEDLSLAYACINKCESDRLNSSSGGMFSIIAKNIYSMGGVVFGAEFDYDNYRVIHNVEDEKYLDKLMRSKYLQSDTVDTYTNVKEKLKNGILVLYTGTACEINGLFAYLGKEYDNLITVDVICHGSPSPKVFEKYVKELEQKHNSKIKDYNFRDKTYGWVLFSTKIEFENGDVEINPLTKDLYMRLFLTNQDLRKSCYNCDCKSNHLSDITIADFWGINNILPNINDDKGVSAVIVHTQKGQDLLKNIGDKITIKEVNLADIVKYNPSYYKSVEEPKTRDKFFNDLDKYSINKLKNKYVDGNIVKRILRNIRYYLGRIYHKIFLK